MKEASRKWLALTLLTGVSLLSMALYLKFYIPKSEEPDIVDTVTASADDKNDDTDTTDDDDIIIETFYNTFPRTAESQANVTYQNIGGINREKLKEVYILSDKSYLIFDTNSDGYDLYAKVPSVAVAAVNDSLTLIKVLTLPCTTEEYYLASKITTAGIMIAVKGVSYTRVYNLDYNLNYVNHVNFELTSSAKFYLTSDEVFLFSLDKNKLYFSAFTHNLELLRSGNIAADDYTSVIEVLPSQSGYNVVVSGENCYAISFFNKNAFTSLNEFFSGSLESVTPVSTGYLILTKEASVYSLNLFDFDLSSLSSTELGAADYAFCYPMGDNYLVTMVSETTDFYLYCRHLERVYKIATVDEPLLIKQAVITDEGLTLLTYGDNNLTVYLVTPSSVTADFNCYAEDTYMRLFKNKLYFSSSAKTTYFKNNFGESDIFILTV